MRALGLNSSTSSLSWPTPRLAPRWKSTVPRRIFIGAAGQHTGGVHLAQGVPASVDGDIVEVEHIVPVAEIDGVQVVLALVVVQQGAGTAGDDTAAQLDAHLLDAGGFACSMATAFQRRARLPTAAPAPKLHGRFRQRGCGSGWWKHRSRHHRARPARRSGCCPRRRQWSGRSAAWGWAASSVFSNTIGASAVPETAR